MGLKGELKSESKLFYDRTQFGTYDRVRADVNFFAAMLSIVGGCI